MLGLVPADGPAGRRDLEKNHLGEGIKLSKVCIIGLDGGTFTVIDYLAKLGRMPNFTRLMEKGSRATLLSTVPPVTWPAWASFYTGCNPGKTGAADLFKFRPGTYRLEPMNAGNLKGTPIWSLASSCGLKVCVYNVPVTYPAIPVNGIMISGLDAPAFNERAIYPSEFRESLLAAIPDFKINYENDARFLVNHHDDPVREWIKRSLSYLDMEIRTINHLMNLEDWDLFVAVIRSTDIFQHTLWGDAEKVIAGDDVSEEELMRAEAVFSCYEAIDRQLGQSGADWLSKGNLVVISDHGFGRLRGHVCVNRVLAEAGLLKFRPRGGSKYKRMLKDRLAAHFSLESKRKIKRFLGRKRSEERWLSYVDSLVADIDWSRTRICAIGGFGCLFVNQKGLHPLGMVDGEAEREAVLAETEAALSELRDPGDGKPMISGFFRKEDLFHGPLMSEMPDLVINLRNWSYCPVIGTARELAEEAIIRPPIQEWKQLAHTGTHRREGILLMHGPDIASGRLGVAQMVDVAPTIMSLLGLPPLDDWDGKVLEDALLGGSTPAARKSHDYMIKEENKTSERAYTDEDEEEVRRRLEDLGYL